MKQLYKTLRMENGELWNRIVYKPDKLEKDDSPASKKEKFSYCIKQKFISGGNYLPGMKLTNIDDSNFGFYISRWKRFYDRYLSKELNIEKHLSPDIKKNYGEGKGNELSSGKFYSVASSSRFAVSCFSEMSTTGKVELLKKIKINGKIEDVNISLEEGLHIEGMPNNATTPQMDVEIKTNSNDTYFIEVKCQEILDNHKSIKLKAKYLNTELFNMLLPQNKDISQENGKTVDYIGKNNQFLTATDFNCNLSTTHFDFKQFLCHLMGILSYKKTKSSEKIHFYYLLYRNEEYLKLPNDSNKQLYVELEAEMSVIFERFGELFKDIDFGYCYNNEFDTLKSLKKETQQAPAGNS